MHSKQFRYAKIATLFLLANALFFISNCNNSSPTIPTEVAAPAVSNLAVADVGNLRDGQDLQISFSKAADESGVGSYRVIVSKTSNFSSFNLSAAEALPAANYTAAPKTGQDITLTLPAGARDRDGDPIVNETPYRVFVLSVADGVNATTNALSAASLEITLISVTDAVSELFVDDVTNKGDGEDLHVAFQRAENEDRVEAYRIIVVKAGAAADFSLEKANALADGNFTVVAKTGGDLETVLATDALDSDGAPVRENVSYRIFVLSIADGVITDTNRLAEPSVEITLAFTTVKVTYLGNNGVLLADSSGLQIIIDGLHRTNTFWIVLSGAETTKIENAQQPYGRIELAMTTHNHGDHFNPQSVRAFFNANPNAAYIAPPQVLSGASQIWEVNPAFRTRVDTTVNGIELSVLHLRHFNQFGNDFSSVENFGYLVQLGGKKLLHLGDVQYSDANFENFNLKDEEIDVVFLPTFNTLISAANRDVIMNHINPKHVIGLHFRAQNVQAETAQVTQLYDNAIVFTMPLEFKRF